MSDLPGSPSGEDAVRVSTLTGDGLAALRAAVAAALAARCPAPSDVPMILRARHLSALDQAREELSLFDALWESDAVPPTIAAVHVRAAVHALDDLIGAVDVQDVLDRVFASFCVGK
jgi:tRNA modification GTPase